MDNTVRGSLDNKIILMLCPIQINNVRRYFNRHSMHTKSMHIFSELIQIEFFNNSIIAEPNLDYQVGNILKFNPFCAVILFFRRFTCHSLR